MNAVAQIEQPKVKRKKQAKTLPIHITPRVLIDPQTGNKVRGFLPAYKADRMLCRERGYNLGDILRASITKKRNPKFNNLVHGLGELVRRHIDGYQDCKDAHDVVKRLQRQSGVCCEVQEIDASPVIEAVLKAAESLLGQAAAKMLAAVLPSIKKINVTVAQSLAFDWMDEAEFKAFWCGICQYLIEHYWHDLDANAIEHLVDVMPEVES